MKASGEPSGKLQTIIAFVSLIVSFAAAGVSYYAMMDVKHQSAALARHTIRREAMTTFLQGDAAFESVLQQIRLSLPVDIEEPNEVNKMTMADMTALRGVVSPVISARHNYNLAFRSTMAAWPKHVRDLLVITGNRSDEVAICYQAASERPLNADELEIVKARINASCDRLLSKWKAFRVATDVVYGDMVNDVVDSTYHLGVDPEAFAPHRPVTKL